MTSARFRYGTVFAITVGLTVFALSVGDTTVGRTCELLAAGAALTVAIQTSGARPAARRGAAWAIGLAVVGVAVGSVIGRPTPAVPLVSTALLLALTVAVISGGLIRLIFHRGVDLTAVFGALSVYLLVGLTFAFLIGAIAVGVSGDYFAQGTDGTQADRVYFSFTSLTTTGFGDFTARTRAGHALSVLEMLIGQLYLVTVIALLVSNLRHGPNGASSPAGGDARSPRRGDALPSGRVELRDPHPGKRQPSGAADVRSLDE
jgi:hypothetical protein